jgi:two-component system, OmpR family, sensor kinase
MRAGGLTLKIYLYSIGAVLATIGMVVVAVSTIRAAHHEDLIAASGHIVRGFWFNHDDALARRRSDDAQHTIVTLYDMEGRLVASTVTPPLPLPSPEQLRGLNENGFVSVGHSQMVHQVQSDGRVVGLGIVKLAFPALGKWIWPLPVLLVLVLIVAVIFARHFARPLERIADAAKRFGRGDPTSRVGIQTRDEIGEVGRAFDAMADRVVRLMAAQQELMANVSHELRTPLARIQVAVDLVTDGKSDRVKELMPDIAQDLAEVERLIEDVMTVAKLDLSRSAGAASVVPLRLELLSMKGMKALVEEAVSRFRSQHPGRELVVQFATSLPAVSADPVLLRRVVDNLLQNACKFSDQNSAIQLCARAADAGVIIAVADKGIGIDPADLEKVFVPFFRSDKSRSRSTGGVGLGLALARRVMDAHDGTIEIRSKPGQGTTVMLTLPTIEPANPMHATVGLTGSTP